LLAFIEVQVGTLKSFYTVDEDGDDDEEERTMTMTMQEHR
jgi:hypothetical protein